MATAKTIYTPVVDEILAALIPGVQSALADNLVGVYLRGSLATGDFIDTSDIDFVVATERPVSDAEAEALIALHARLAALPNPYADRLEGAYIDRASLRRFEPGRQLPHRRVRDAAALEGARDQLAHRALGAPREGRRPSSAPTRRR